MASQLDDRARVAGTAFILFCFSLFLTAYTAKHPGLARFFHQGFAEVLRPLQMFNEEGSSRILNVWSNYFALWGVREENEKYKARLAVLEAGNAKYAEIESENHRLRKLLDVKAARALQSVTAMVIARAPSSWVQNVTIDRGSRDGIEPGMPVIEGDGIVGQVVAVSPNTARVMLIIDRASGVDAVVQESRVRGIIDGSGNDRCEFHYIGESEEISVGDKIVTSGLDGVFPKGLIVGVVTSVERSSDGLFKAIQVNPSVKFSKLENVLVLTGPEANFEQKEGA